METTFILLKLNEQHYTISRKNPSQYFVNWLSFMYLRNVYLLARYSSINFTSFKSLGRRPTAFHLRTFCNEANGTPSTTLAVFNNSLRVGLNSLKFQLS